MIGNRIILFFKTAMTLLLLATSSCAADKLNDKVAQLETRNAELEKRLAAVEAQLAKLTPPPPVDREAERLENIRKYRADFVRYSLVREVRQNAVRSAQRFCDLTDARYRAGQVTSLDVHTSEVRLHGCQVELASVERLRLEAEAELKECAGGEADKLMTVPAVDFGVRIDPQPRAPAAPGQPFREETGPVVVADFDAGKISLVTSEDGKVVSTKLIFQASRVANAEITKAIDNSPEAKKNQFRRKLYSSARQLNTLEMELMFLAKKVESAKRTVEAAKISFERGLKDSFDVLAAEDWLLNVEVQFVTNKTDYELVREQIGEMLKK